MKKLLILLFILLLPNTAFAAISASNTWEVRATNGSDTNGGGFVPAVTSISSKTDLAVSSGSNLNVSSASYGFTSADVGRYINVTAGTGFTTGLYKITGVTTGVATLSASPAAVNATGGSFTIYYGLDYSQQNAKNVNGGSNGSSVIASYVSGTTITCADCQFTNDIDGNIIYVAGGTGTITGGWYQATFASSTSITVDRSTGLVAGTGITLNVGGALQTINQLATNLVAGGKAFIKAEATYTTTATITFAQNTGNGTFISGYTTTRRDGGHATLQEQTTSSFSALTLTGQHIFLSNLTIDCNSLTGSVGITMSSYQNIVDHSKIMNYASYGIFANNQGIFNGVYYTEITGGISGAVSGISMTASNSNADIDIVMGSYVHDGVGGGINVTGGGVVASSIVSNMSGATSDGITASSVSLVYGNSVYNSGRDGIRFASYSIGGMVLGNILVSNGGFGVNFSSALQPAMPSYDGNAYYNNTSGTRNNMNGTTGSFGVNPYVNTRDVIMTGNPFVNAAGGNFGLNTTSGAGAVARSVGIPTAWPGLGSTSGFPSLGAVQPQATNISGGAFAFGQ